MLQFPNMGKAKGKVLSVFGGGRAASVRLNAEIQAFTGVSKKDGWLVELGSTNEEMPFGKGIRSFCPTGALCSLAVLS